MKKTITFFACLITGLTLLSFVSKKNKAFETSKCFKQKFALVPSGSVFIDGSETQVEGFYISKTEVANYEYNRFVQDIAASGNTELLNRIKLDANQWESICGNKPLVLSYCNSPMYSQYPAVNMTYDGAIEYCKWLTEKANKESTNGLIYEYRLPTRLEWIRAAEGEFHRIDFAWGGPNARNNKGCMLCQCNRSTEPKPVFDMTTYTSPTKSYFANSIGLYNMNGNVAELISEKGVAVGGSWASKDTEVKNLSVMSYEKPSPLVGFRPIVVVKNGKTSN